MLSIAILYALIGTIGWGLSNAAAKKLVLRFGSVRAIVFRNIIAVAVLISAVLIIGIPERLSFVSLGFGVLLSAVGYFPFLFFLKGLERGKVGIVYSISSGWVIVASTIGFLFLEDAFSFSKIAAFGIIMLGVIFASIDFREIRNSDLFSIQSGAPYALVAALLWGIVFAFFKFPSQALGGVFFALIVEGMVLLSASVHLLLTHKKLIEKNDDIKDLASMPWYVILSGFGAGLGTSFINLGYATGQIALVSAVAASQILIASLFASRFYGERLTVKQYTGVIFVLLGVAVASII